MYNKNGDFMKEIIELLTKRNETISTMESCVGGGIANAIMRNDLKRLGLRRQQYGVIELWEKSEEQQSS